MSKAIVSLTAGLMAAATWGVECRAASAASEERITCEGTYPYHLQGVATDGTNVYWSFTTVLAKTDLKGRLLARCEREHAHMGDLCCKDGKVYVGMNYGPGGDVVWRFDAATLAFEKSIPTPQTVFCNNGLEWYGDSFFIIGAVPQHSVYNVIYEYDRNFKFRGCRFIDSGWTFWGVQTIAVIGDKMVFGYYGTGGPVMPHAAGTFVVKADDMAIGRQNAEFPTIIPSLGRVAEDTSEGIVAIGGKVWKARSRKIPEDKDKPHPRFTGWLTPATKLTAEYLKGLKGE